LGLALGLYSYPSSGGESTSYSPRLAPAAQYCTDSPSATLARAHSAATAVTLPSNSVVTNAKAPNFFVVADFDDGRPPRDELDAAQTAYVFVRRHYLRFLH